VYKWDREKGERERRGGDRERGTMKREN